MDIGAPDIPPTSERPTDNRASKFDVRADSRRQFFENIDERRYLRIDERCNLKAALSYSFIG